MRLAGKVILVTGASSGIGLATARALVREGAAVALAARSIDRLEAEAARAAGEGGKAVAVQMDVTSAASVEAAIAAVLARFGRIDVLINNAGNAGSLELWASADPAALRAMFDVHVLGAERVMRAVLPAMLAQRSGIVVNIASAVAWVPMPSAAAYSAAKAAIVAFSEAVREELSGQGIDVRVFAPPHTSTEAGRTWPLDLPKIFEPEWVAADLVRALRGKRARVVSGGNNLLLLMQRLSPRLAAGIMNRLGWKAVAKVSGRKATAAAGLPA